MKSPVLLLVDGHAYAYRAFYAIRRLRSPTGQPTNALYGFIQMLGRLLPTRPGHRGLAVRAVEPAAEQWALAPATACQPAPLAEPARHATHALVVWDGGLAAERLAAWPAYKAQRPPLPADLAPQLDEMAVWLQAAGVASFCAEGVEADDYIATQTRQAERAGWDVLIASSDKDFMQLVSARIGLVNPSDRHETVWTAAHVRARTGVAPKQIVDWLSLAGDSVDNIPGVPGVGPKTAAALLQRFGSLDDLYANLAAVDSASLRARLAGAETGVRRNRGLIRLRDDLPYAFSAAALAVRPPDESGLCELYARWGFRSLLAATPSAAGRQVNLF